METLLTEITINSFQDFEGGRATAQRINQGSLSSIISGEAISKIKRASWAETRDAP
jgi:hypothetical protein